MPLLALNAAWLVIEALFFLLLARRVRFALAGALALAAAFFAFAVATRGFVSSFQAMRAASFALFVHAPALLLLFAWQARARPRSAALLLASAAGLIAVAADAFLYEPHALRTSSYVVRGPSDLRIVVMSDIQVTAIGPYERSVFARIAELRPDLVLLAGDYVQTYGSERAAVVADFRSAWRDANIHPRLGVFAVRGDVEPDGWEDEIFGGLDVTTSDRTRLVRAGDASLLLLALRDSADPAFTMPRIDSSSLFVLGHRPDFALGTGQPAMLVAGHTHGGQVQLPFFGPPMILSAVPRAWGAGGLHDVGLGRSLLVSRGAGVEHAGDAPPIRFGCRPEIVELVVRR